MTRPSRNGRACIAPNAEVRPVPAPTATTQGGAAERACVDALRRIAEAGGMIADAGRALAENLPLALAERRRTRLMSGMEMDAITPPAPELLNCTDLASLLGMHVRTLRRMRRAGEVPAPIKIGGAERWRRTTIDAWIAEREERAK